MLLFRQKVYVTLFPCGECAKLLIQVNVLAVMATGIDFAAELFPESSRDSFRPASRRSSTMNARFRRLRLQLQLQQERWTLLRS